MPKTDRSAGLHLGIQNLAVTSDGECFENHRYLEKSRRKLNRLQKELSRKTSGGKNHEKARLKLAKAYERIANQKMDTLHKLTTELVRNYDTICVRDISFEELRQSRIFTKYCTDAGWSLIIRQLSYKCEWYGKEFIKTEQLFPSTRLCSCCGHKNDKLKPHQSEWNCPKCGKHHNRRINAANNILNEGLRMKTA